MRWRVEFQKPADVVTYDETNAPIETWETVSTRWAEVKALSAGERVAAQSLQAEVTHQITLRSGFDVLPTYRIKLGTKILNIVSVVPDIDRTTITAVQVIGET
ncbi:phage head closure protein [Anatilimnocola floriformis]|uniref:phage head closure protein n=1 Tax=Anatilimnocola floriformis TaxID=2948575 RepID=UPI0020C3EE27|nr:phage head closure protein [Anatilimnocola floriformis]